MTDPVTPGLTPIQAALLERADGILSAIGGAMGKAGTAVVDQLPDVAHQYIMYGRTTSTLGVLCGLMFMAFGAWLIRRLIASPDKFTDEGIAFSIIIGIISLGVGFATLGCNIDGFIMSWFAPKIWLLTNLVELIHKVHG